MLQDNYSKQENERKAKEIRKKNENGSQQTLTATINVDYFAKF